MLLTVVIHMIIFASFHHVHKRQQLLQSLKVMEGSLHNQEMKPVLWKPLLCIDSFLSLCSQQMLETERHFFEQLNFWRGVHDVSFNFKPWFLNCAWSMWLGKIPWCVCLTVRDMWNYIASLSNMFQGRYGTNCIWKVLWINLNHMREVFSPISYKTSFIIRATTTTMFIENSFFAFHGCEFVSIFINTILMPFLKVLNNWELENLWV